MASTKPSLAFSLIVAATPSMGIGKGGALPWPMIRSEMAYFARTTKRAPEGQLNAVIMGRKTWESIPIKFRPLPGRLNIVVTRNESWKIPNNEVLIVNSIEAAFTKAQEIPSLHRAFVIGGAQLYAASLAHPDLQRILLTRIDRDYDCDAKFALNLPVDSEYYYEWHKLDRQCRDAWLSENLTEGAGWSVEMWQRS